MAHSFLYIFYLFFVVAFRTVAAAKASSKPGVSPKNATITPATPVKDLSSTLIPTSTENNTTIFWTSTIYLTLTNTPDVPVASSTEAAASQTQAAGELNNGGGNTGIFTPGTTHGPWSNTTTPSVKAEQELGSSSVGIQTVSTSEVTTTVTATTTLTVTATAVSTHFATLTHSCLPGSTLAPIKSRSPNSR